MPKFHKLVRDKIPEIIESKGQKAITTTLHTEEYLVALKKKMLEEWDEYLQAADDASALEELADLLEVIHALAKTHGASLQTVETLRKEKCEERGGFDRRVFLHCRKDDI
ncbi:phosphoribosyl-ATP pyrophosphohydrolase [Virgibacillus dokdonensis]|uniref:Phosphoribosyl-ATP pyrophosphohydrolase n=1 Tax=Virgibacillus dokdonensis TaxID=302167 RepID=A0A3E0WMU6_9BACI|nr:nucleoside triphosphate pyrophosphohydrolase [Virgibacillus dokdonensis]RFA34284.1 phosphoribosyl-ATP pyrophosphohydrolase [Virgibacillus dokdonensis]